MSLPPNSEQDSGDNSSSNQSSGTGHHKKVKAGIFSTDALEISGGLIFLVIGGGFHIAGGWFHIAGFMCDFLVVCCGLTIITHHVETFKLFGFRYWISLGVTFIIFSSLAFYVVRKEKIEPPSASAANTKPVEAVKSSATNAPPFSVIGKSSLGTPPLWGFDEFGLIRLYDPILITFVNLQDYPITFDSYSIDGETNGTWFGINYEPRRNQAFDQIGEFGKEGVTFEGDGHNAQMWEWKTFDSAVRDKSIGSHETITGWVFFVIPMADTTNYFHFRLADTAGNFYPPQPIIWKGSLGFPIQGDLLLPIFTTNYMDITKLPQNKGFARPY
jgi:hypothetical protein